MTTRGPSRDDLHEGVLAGLLGYQLAQAEIATRRLYGQHIGEPMQLKAVEFTILMLLLANAEVTGKRLCETLSISAPNLSILLDRLEQRGVLQRVRSETDRRSQYLHLTAEGLALARQARQIAVGMEAELQQSVSPAEHAMLVELLRKIASHRD